MSELNSKGIIMEESTGLDEIVHNLKARGYKAYFSLEEESIYCMAGDEHVSFGEFSVDEFYKVTEKGTVQYVFAITPTDGVKGTLIEGKAAFERRDGLFLIAFLFNSFENSNSKI